MYIKFRVSVQGLGYFAGDTAEVSDALASEIVARGEAIVVPPTDGDNDTNTLPADMPMRQLLWDNGYDSVAQIFDAKETLKDISGIGDASAERIVKYCQDAVKVNK